MVCPLKPPKHRLPHDMRTVTTGQPCVCVCVCGCLLGYLFEVRCCPECHLVLHFFQKGVALRSSCCWDTFYKVLLVVVWEIPFLSLLKFRKRFAPLPTSTWTRKQKHRDHTDRRNCPVGRERVGSGRDIPRLEMWTCRGSLGNDLVRVGSKRYSPQSESTVGASPSDSLRFICFLLVWWLGFQI